MANDEVTQLSAESRDSQTAKFDMNPLREFPKRC